MAIFAIAVLIFLVTDPFGDIAIHIAALQNVAPKQRLWALALLLLFLTFGDKELGAPGLSREASAIAGGIILFVIAMRPIGKACLAMGRVDWRPWSHRRWPASRPC